MSLNKRLVLIILNDFGIYRMLLFTLLFLEPVLYYLCYRQSYAPLYLHLIPAALSAATLAISVLLNKRAYTIALYITAIAFLAVHSGILLLQNNFSYIYLFSAIVVFGAVNFLCKKRGEFVALAAVNITIVFSAYFWATSPLITSFGVAALSVAFIIISYAVFLTRLVYGFKFKRAIDNLTTANKTLVNNERKLRDSRNQLHSLINSINDIVFEASTDRTMLNIWHSGTDSLFFEKGISVNEALLQITTPEQEYLFIDVFDEVAESGKANFFEFPSTEGRWFRARMAPVFDRQGINTTSVSVSLSDITHRKHYEQALRHQKDLLLEAHNIAKLGNWWYDGQTAENGWADNIFTILETKEIPAGQTKYEYYLSLVHPDDLEKTKDCFSTITTSAEATFEHKVITPNGNLKYLKVVRGNLTFNDDGSLKHVSGVIQDITEIRTSARLAKISQKELLEAQTIAKIGNWKFELAERSLSWSAEIAKMYKIKSRSAGLKKFFTQFLLCVHPDDRKSVLNIIRNPEKAVNVVFEYRYMCAPNCIKYMSLIVGKIIIRGNKPRKIIGTLQDVTERRLAENSLKQSELKYRTALESVKLAAITINSEGDVTFCNSYLAELLGYTSQQIIGLNWIDTFTPENLRAFLKFDPERSHQNSQVVYPVLCRNGEQRVISWKNTLAYNENGDIAEITGIGEDITDIQRATQELISAKESAERASKFKSEFLSTMSHEIRTPMNAVIGLTNLLLSENPQPEQLEYLNTLKFSGENLLAIINDILDYNKIEAGKFELITQPVNIKQLLNKIWTSFVHRAEQKGIALKLVADASIPEFLMADQVRLSQIMNNLISNSIKFTHTGSVTIKAMATPIDQNNEVNIRFSVADTGIGISPEKINVIFDPFEQDATMPDSNLQVAQGTGLGLAITKRLIELHHSHIEVASIVGEGSIFTFDIVFTLADAPLPATPDASLTSPRQDLHGIKVLVVDDNKMNLLIATRFLKRWHARVDEATNGKDAINLVQQNSYDVIIMDLQMPSMDGFEATRIIRQTHPHIPVMALTADAMSETFAKAQASGMNDYLTKPFMPETLFKKISKYLPINQ